jgi:hypothetical protein
MALPQADNAPPPEYRQRLNAFLAELAPAIPTGVELDPSWEADYSGWTLWVRNHDRVGAADYDRFIEVGHELAAKHGVEMDLIPAEVRSWD